MARMHALIGKWDMKPCSRGLSVMSYDTESGAMDAISTFFEEVIVGNQLVYPEKNIVYICDEREDRDGWVGGGGYVLAIRIDPDTGDAAIVSRKESLAVGPSYLVMDKTRRYLLVTHHGKRGHATKIVKRPDGSFGCEVVFDDAALVLFRVDENGSLRDACDVYITPGEGASGRHVISHQHSITAAPTGELFFVCDKGTDKIYTFRVNSEAGKLVFLKEFSVMEGSAPRYSVVHPTLPVVFQNNENKAEVNTWSYDGESGSLALICTAQLFSPEELAGLEAVGFEPNGSCMFGPSDIVISPDGKRLYCGVRKANRIVSLDVDDKGCISARQVVDCGGVNPRGLSFSPDGRFLFSANVESGNIARFVVNPDGDLFYDGNAAGRINIPANIAFMSR